MTYEQNQPCGNAPLKSTGSNPATSSRGERISLRNRTGSLAHQKPAKSSDSSTIGVGHDVEAELDRC